MINEQVLGTNAQVKWYWQITYLYTTTPGTANFQIAAIFVLKLSLGYFSWTLFTQNHHLWMNRCSVQTLRSSDTGRSPIYTTKTPERYHSWYSRFRNGCNFCS